MRRRQFALGLVGVLAVLPVTMPAVATPTQWDTSCYSS
jgi:hypothetical protein